MKIATNISLLALLTALNHLASAQQNLVPNGSFEEYSHCPTTYGDLFTTFWTSPTSGSPDYFNTCNVTNANIGVPDNSYGSQNPLTGNAYVGFVAYTPYDYFEYVQVPLTRPLLAGHKYYVSFYVSLADRVRYAIKEIGVFFSNAEINTGIADPLLLTPQVEFGDSIITDTVGWTNIKGEFTAQGNEQFLIIGNFRGTSNTTIADVNNTNSNGSYYYLDEVSVVEVAEFSVPLQMPTAFTPNGDSKNDTYYPVFFDSLLTVHEFRIYNRWGQLIYDNPTTGWNGNYKGESQPSDVYNYYIYADIPLPDNPNEHAILKKQGSFTLFR